jgi:FtsH-binding integral membrane protein
MSLSSESNNFGRGVDSISGGAVQAAQQNQVLRNTYMLLAATMIPTILGAALGVMFKLPIPGGFLSAILFLAVAFGFFYAIEKNKHSVTGVYLLLGFTFFMGIMLSSLLNRTLGLKNGAQLIGLACGGVAAIFFGMSALASTIKRDLSGMGKFLFVGAIMVMVAALANIFFKIPALHIGILIVVLGLFTAYLLYDIKQVLDGYETNYISATLSIYLDVYNIFTSLLQLLGIVGGDRD